MKRLILAFILLAIHTGFAANEIHCEKKYKYHLQGVATDNQSIYWSFSDQLVKTDLTGKVIKDRQIVMHSGDLCVKDGKVYIATDNGLWVTGKKLTTEVRMYDAQTLQLEKVFPLPETKNGCSSITSFKDGFYIGLGLPEKPKEEVHHNLVFEYTPDFKLVKKHRLDTGYTIFGIQTICFARNKFYIGYYGTKEVPYGTFLATPDLKKWKRIRTVTDVGVMELNGILYAARTGKDKDKKWFGKLIPFEDPYEDGCVDFIPEPPKDPAIAKPFQKWLDAIGAPKYYYYKPSLKKIRSYSFSFGDAEVYQQANGPKTSQCVIMLFPKDCAKPVPAVVIPYYFPEAMLGFEPGTGKVLPSYKGVTMMTDLAKRGYATISAESYHLTYCPDLKLPQNAFKRWKISGETLNREHPEWTGIGKLVADTKLLIDALCADSRVDASRIGIAGHSLGGKMAFYTGFLDKRIKVILSSDFGMRFEQTNWQNIWYWGEKLNGLKAQGLDHSQLLSANSGKPFMLLAGQADNEQSWKMMRRASGYEKHPEHLKIINHATGHRPPAWALEKGYDFLDEILKRP